MPNVYETVARLVELEREHREMAQFPSHLRQGIVQVSDNNGNFGDQEALAREYEERAVRRAIHIEDLLNS